jgi:CelD/BcsL family acetyltransferase involved in cellulose biosynthesis
MTRMNAFMRTANGADAIASVVRFATGSVAAIVPVAATGSVAAIGPVARVDIIDDIAAAEPVWRGLEISGAVASPYQRFDFIAPWQRHVGRRKGVRPFLVVGSDARGTPLFLLPLGRTRHGPLEVAGFLGGKHANFNGALWRRDVAASIDRHAMETIVAMIRQAGGGADLLMLTNQPQQWEGVANPLAALRHQPSPSFACRGALAKDFAALVDARVSATQRKKLRKKERVLAGAQPIRYWRAETADEALRVLDVFFAQKAERMAELGLADAFAAPGMREFITAAATAELASGRPAIELYAASVGDTIVATYGGLVGNGRFSGIFNSMIRNELAHESPGQLLLFNLVRMCCERGLTTFDLGVGEAAFKQLFCNEPEPLFDSFLPLTPLGRAAAAACRLRFALKRRIKRSPPVWATVRAMRRRLAGRRTVRREQ